jgi:hypothetical protein
VAVAVKDERATTATTVTVFGGEDRKWFCLDDVFLT